MKQVITLDELRIELRDQVARQSQRSLATRLGVSPQYLSDVLLGRREPGPSMLDGMGLEREVRYRRRG